jgi:hypothetical protein
MSRANQTTTSLIAHVAVGAVGAVLLFIPPSFPAIFSLPLFAWWFLAWLLDARMTGKNWSFVEGYEVNALVRPLARRMPGKHRMVFALHALFSFAAAAGLQALVTHRFDAFLTACILAIFGLLHIEAFYHNRAFLSRHWSN